MAITSSESTYASCSLSPNGYVSKLVKMPTEVSLAAQFR